MATIGRGSAVAEIGPVRDFGPRRLADLALHPHLLADRLSQSRRGALGVGLGVPDVSASRPPDHRRASLATVTGRRGCGTEMALSPARPISHESRRRRARRSRAQCPHAVPRARPGRPGVDVDLVGLEGTPLPRLVTDDPRHPVHRLKPSVSRFRHEDADRLLGDGDRRRPAAGIRLWRRLRTLPRPDLVLVQNPPAFPTLAVTWFALRGADVRFVIDWHNLGYTLLQRRLGRWHPAVRIARWIERRDARRVDANLCVSRGMAAFLQSRFGVLTSTCCTTGRPRCSCRWTGRRANDSVRGCSVGWASSADRPASSSVRRAGPKTKTSTS